MTFAEYTKKKKKEEEEAKLKSQQRRNEALSIASTIKGGTSFKEYTETVLGVDLDDDIAPVKTTVTDEKEEKDKKEKDSWFTSGAMDDGVSLKNIGKTILGTVGDAVEDIGAGILGLGEKALDAMLTVAPYAAQSQYYNDGGVYQPLEVQKINQQRFDEAKKGNAEIIAKDLYSEEKIAKAIISNPIKNTTGFDIEESSVLGTKSDALSQSGGQLLATAGLQAVGVPWFLTTGASAFGSEAENALNQGATLEEAGLSATISAGAEILTEKLSGGIKFGGKTLDDALTKRLATSISNKVVRNGLKIGMDVVGEGSEEVVSSVFSRLGSALYKEESIDELLTSEEAIDEYIDSFIGGAILGGIASTGRNIKSGLNGVDEVTGLNQSEQKVFDKVYNDAIAEAEADGKKLTSKEKSKLYDSTMNALEKGYIDTDTIESVLGGDTYSTLKDITEQETASQQEYDNLYQMKNGEKSDAQIDRQKELRKYLDSTKIKKAQLREELDSKIDGFIQDNRLTESYLEKVRRKQNFEADLTQYTNENAKKTVQNFMEHTKSNDTNATHDFVDLLTRVSEDRGHTFDFTTTEQLEKSIKDGNPHNITVDPSRVEAFVDGKNKTIVINMSANKSLNSLVGHEIAHTTETAGLYNNLQQSLFKYAEMKGEYADRLASIKRRYSNLSEEAQNQELTADLLGDYIFTDGEFIRNLSAEQPNVFKRIYNEIKYFCKMATAGSREARELERAKHLFEKIYRETSETYNDSDVKFSVRKEAPPKETGIAYKVFYVKDGKLYPPMVANPDGADTPVGVWLNADVGESAPPSKTGRAQVKAGGKGTQGGSGSLAFRPGWHLGDLPRASQFDRVNPENGKKELFPENFVWAEVEYAKDADYQEEAMSYGYTDNGKFRHAYAGLPKIPENGYYRYRTNPKPDTVPWIITGAMKVNRILSDAEVNAILEENGVSPVHRQGGDVELEKFGFNNDGSVKYSISDSTGRQITKGQQDFFKDSKVRDENGNLKVMYHGTPNGDFTVFRDGTYFTDSKEYADVYQTPSASSISTGKVASNPKTFEVYLNITKPFDINDAEARDIYINDYIKGGNATGINPYLSDAEYSKIKTIDWVEGEDLRDFLIDNGYDYDGLVLDEGATGGFGDEVVSRGVSYVTFSPEQVKNIDNVKPTSDPDIRFSLSDTVEETKDLIAVHNIGSAQLLKTIELGGFPMPSIAITKDDYSHNEYGEISILFGKETIDPQFFRNNKVYGGDAWTPVYPKIEYEVNDKVQRAISEKYYKLHNKIPSRFDRTAYRLVSDLEDMINREGGEAGLIESLKNDYGIKQFFLAETGTPVEDVIISTTTEMTEAEKEMCQYFLDNARELVESYKQNRGNPQSFLTWTKENSENIKNAYRKYLENVLSFTEDEIHNVLENTKPVHLKRFVSDAVKYEETGGVTTKEEYSSSATYEAIDNAVNQSEYEEWLNALLKGVELSSGIRNNVDYFTPSGNRRSFKALHYENTLENVVKVMKDQDNGQAFFSGLGIWGVSAKDYGSIEEIKADSHRLEHRDASEYSELKQGFGDRLTEIANKIVDKNHYNQFIAMDNAMDNIVDAVRKSKRPSDIARYLEKYSDVQNSLEVAQEIVSLVNDISNMPTEYFEAKPQRAVGLDEIATVILPKDADEKLKAALSEKNIPYVEYDGTAEDRLAKLNGEAVAKDKKFSLSEQGKNPKQYGDYNVYAKDILLEQDIAPVKDSMTKTVKDNSNLVIDDYAPLTEEQANERDAERSGEEFVEVPDDWDDDYLMYNGTFANHSKPADPFYDRDIWEVGRDRKVKAYMYEHPEVKPFFQQEAEYMLGELNRSVKGERFYNDKLYYDTNGEMGIFGTKRETSEEIAYLLDTFNYTYKDIAKGLNAIIEDNGKENNAISKRIEFMLDERLRLGYTDFGFGDKIAPNQDYINLLNSKEITEYNDESWNNWLRNLSDDDIKTHFSARDNVVPPEEYIAAESDIAPVRETVEPEAPLYENATGQQTMFEEPKKPQTLTRSTLHKNIIKGIKDKFVENSLNLDDELKNAKNLSTFATVDNTPQRVMEKALGYKAGQVLSDVTVNKVAQNETEGIKWLNSFTDRQNGLLRRISKQYHIKPGSKESAAAQMYAEGFYVNDNNEIISYGDAELAKDFPNREVQANIRGLAKDERIRQIYDETLRMINESRARNAYPEIPRLDNYFLHFRAMEDTFSRLGLPFNPNDIRAKDLPTDLNGVTADLKPGQPYFASAMHRTGKRTSFDLLGGLERYLTSAKNQIYHIDDIQTLRALRNYIADTYGQANGLEGLDALSEEEAQERIEKVYSAHLSTFAKFLNEEANVLAGKTALIDRGFEGMFGRRAFTFMDTINRQVGSNMVGFNVSSSLTNFLPVVQTFAKSNKADFVKAFAQTASNKINSIFGRSDGFADQSPVMIRRNGADRFYRTPFQKAADAGYVLMGAVDNISTELIARTKYNELIRKGMDAQKAHYETDKWVSRLMGDRSIGQLPQLYNSKTLGIITKFQLEVRNQLDSQFYDTIQEAKVSSEDIQSGLARNAKTAAKVASTFVQLAVAQHLFGKAFESVAGYNPAFDIIEVLLTACGYDDEEDSEDTALDNIEQGFLALLEDLPYTSTFTGGRIPISSALPITELIKGEDKYGVEKSRGETLKEIAPYYVLPTGYGQIKKTAQGLSMFDDDLPIAGSYTDSGNLRFPIDDTPENRVKAGLFGQWASENARDYFDNERTPLKEKQIQEFIDVDIPIRDYWEYREGLSGLENLSEKADYINSLDLPIDKKNILINNLTDRKEEIDLTGFDEDYEDFEEFDFAVNNPEKYEIAQKVGGYKAYVSYKEGMKGLTKLEEKADYIASLDLTTEQKNALINGETDRKEPIDLTGYENYGSFEEFEYAKAKPGKHAISKAVGGYESYVSYLDELNDIRADKDADGDSIPGSAKEKKWAYINGLNLDYGQKIILYRSLYDSKADKAELNADIVQYLDSRDDITYDEMVTILEELDMKMYPDGRVTW